jgi:hypothetical protein
VPPCTGRRRSTTVSTATSTTPPSSYTRPRSRRPSAFAGYDDDVVVAGLLHDAVEDSEAQVADVRERFGDRVATIVAAVTEDPAIADYHARKAELRARVAAADTDALAVFAADKLVKTRELRAQATGTEARLAEPDLVRRREHYEQCLEMLRDAAPELPIVQLLAFELWALRILPPR